MKHFYKNILCSLILLFCASTYSFGSIEVNGIHYILDTKTETAKITKYDADGYKGDIIIPATITYNKKVYKVTEWYPSVFYNNKELTSITLGANILSYLDWTVSSKDFQGCDKLQNIFVDKDNKDYSSVDGVLYTKDKKSLKALPTGRTGSYAIPEGTTQIEQKALYYCNISEIGIPSTINKFKEYLVGFDLCPNLKKINVDIANNSYSSIDGVLTNKAETEIITYPLGKKASYIVPEKIKSIGFYAFYNCGISSITLQASVKKINDYAFKDTKTILTIEGTYDSYSFLSKLDKNSTVYVHHSELEKAKKIFSGCYNIEKCYIESQTEALLGKVSFTINKPQFNPNLIYQSTNPKDPKNGTLVYGYKFESLTVDNKEITPNEEGVYTVDNLLPNTKYEVKLKWTHYSKKDVIAETGEDVDYIQTKAPTVSTFTREDYDYQGGSKYVSKFTDKLQAHIKATEDESLAPSETGYYVKELKKNYPSNEDGIVYVSDLYPEEELSFIPYAIYRDKTYQWEDKLFVFKTATPEFNVSYKCTQTTFTINSVTVVDRDKKDTKPTSISLKIGGKEYRWENKPITIKGLSPDSYNRVFITATYGEDYTVKTEKSISTLAIEKNIEVVNVGPTTIHLKGSYVLGDAIYTNSHFDGYKEGDEITVNGLTPNKEYTFKYYVNGVYKSIKVKTSSLTIETLTPKVLANSSAIVCAKTNISDEETNVGFEWRKIDAPAIVESKSGKAIVYVGTMEGRINNLDVTSYYKVRPYYKSSQDIMYYGDWTGFDPSDFSYFEPTVHTYAKIDVQANTAKVRGVALQGTDDIIEQGFEYWAEAAAKTRAGENVQKVQATGQSMEADLTGLAYNTTYNYRAYVKTASGTTYGETQQFTTPADEATGINNINGNASGELNFAIRQEGNLQISISGNNEECYYNIVNISGNQVFHGKAIANNDWQTITDNRLPSGLYIISVNNGNQKKAKKIAIK